MFFNRNLRSGKLRATIKYLRAAQKVSPKNISRQKLFQQIWFQRKKYAKYKRAQIHQIPFCVILFFE